MLKPYQLIPITICVYINTLSANSLENLTKIVGAGKSAYDANKQEKYTPIVTTGIATAGGTLETLGKESIKKSDILLKNSKKLDSLATRTEKLIKKYPTIFRNKKNLTNISQVIKKFKTASSSTLKYASKVKNKGKYIKSTGQLLGGAVSIYDAYTKTKEFKNKVKNDEATALDTAIYIKDMAVNLESNIPVLGTVVALTDLGVDIAAETTDVILDKKREKSIRQSDTIYKLLQNANTIAKQNIKRETEESGKVLTDERIKYHYKKQYKTVLNILEGMQIENHIADGDVALKAKKDAQIVAQAIVDNPDKRLSIGKKLSQKILDLKTIKENLNEMQNLRDNNTLVVKKLKHINEKVLATSQIIVQTNTLLQENKTTQISNKGKVKITSKNDQLIEQENKAKKLRLENEKLTEEYIALSIKAKKNPNDTKLQKQLKIKKSQLGSNAFAFQELRKEIIAKGGDNPGYVNGYNSSSILNAINKETSKVEQITFNKQEIKNSKPENTKNSNAKTIAKLKHTDANLREKLTALHQTQNRLKQKQQELLNAKNRLSGTQKYTTVTATSSRYNQKKLNYLKRARNLANKYHGKPFSSWSKSDKVSMGIIARNLGIASSSTITHKGAILNGMLRLKGFDSLKQRYAYNASSTVTKSIYNYDYANIENSVANLQVIVNQLANSLNAQKNEIIKLEKEKYTLLNNVTDDLQDYNNNIKVQTTLDTGTDTTSTTPTIQKHDWRGNFTFKAEEQSGALVYTGGNWGTTEEHLQYGASELFSFENNNPDIVKGGHFEHGTNTATDNTKQFDITANGPNNDIKNLNITQDVGNSNTLSFKETGHYNYTVWGEWAQTGGLKTEINGGSGLDLTAQHNNWIVGEVTKDLPTQGSATYSGAVKGSYYGLNDRYGEAYAGKIDGTMSMTVDFTNTSVVSGILDLQKQNGSTFATAHMDQIQIDRNSRAFSGRLVGTNLAPLQSHTDPGGTSYNNQINGSFYGPNAEEIGGTWKVTNTNNDYASGTFAGKR